MNNYINDFLNEIHTENYQHWLKRLSDHPLGQKIIDDLKDLPQILKYHPEFCTLKHTFLVVVSLKRMGADHLLGTGLLHDWGKPETTVIRRNGISSLGHDRMGAKKIENLDDDDKDEWISNPEKMVWIIKRHMSVYLDHKKIQNPPKNKNEYWKDLGILIKADKEISRRIYWDLFDQTDYQRNQYLYHRELFEHKYFDHTIYLMVGIPGSGKSTFIKNNNLEKYSTSKDKWRRIINGDVSSQEKSKLVNEKYQEDALNILMKHKKVFLDETGIFKNRRNTLFSILPQVTRTAIILPADVDKSFQRIQDDLKEGKDRSDVPYKVIEKFNRGYEKFREGNMSEFHNVLEIENPLSDSLKSGKIILDQYKNINKL